jgi:hypothetical protein
MIPSISFLGSFRLQAPASCRTFGYSFQKFGQYWIRTSDPHYVKVVRYQLRQLSRAFQNQRDE